MSEIACSLDAAAMPGRLEQWRALLEHAVEHVRLASGALRLLFDQTIDAADVARLAAAEQQCCAFFSFTITIDARGVALEVSAPTEADAIVSELFGTPD